MNMVAPLNEQWKSVNDNYMISNTGKIKSLERTRVGKHGFTVPLHEKILKQSIDKKGYHSCSLYENEKPKTYYIHRLVAEAFIENLLGLPEVNHKDGNKSNNTIGNLEWSTHADNMKHGHITGLINNNKLTLEQRKEIINLKGSMTQKEISKLFGVSKQLISFIHVNNG